MEPVERIAKTPGMELDDDRHCQPKKKNRRTEKKSPKIRFRHQSIFVWTLVKADGQIECGPQGQEIPKQNHSTPNRESIGGVIMIAKPNGRMADPGIRNAFGDDPNALAVILKALVHALNLLGKCLALPRVVVAVDPRASVIVNVLVHPPNFSVAAPGFLVADPKLWGANQSEFEGPLSVLEVHQRALAGVNQNVSLWILKASAVIRNCLGHALDPWGVGVNARRAILKNLAIRLTKWGADTSAVARGTPKTSGVILNVLAHALEHLVRALSLGEDPKVLPSDRNAWSGDPNGLVCHLTVVAGDPRATVVADPNAWVVILNVVVRVLDSLRVNPSARALPLAVSGADPTAEVPANQTPVTVSLNAVVHALKFSSHSPEPVSAILNVLRADRKVLTLPLVTGELNLNDVVATKNSSPGILIVSAHPQNSATLAPNLSPVDPNVWTADLNRLALLRNVLKADRKALTLPLVTA
jgi:hypothetical protein